MKLVAGERRVFVIILSVQASRAVAFFAVLQVCGSVSAQVSIEDVGRFDFTLSNVSADGLSGIAYVGADEYIAVSDADAYLYRFAIGIDLESGRVESVEVLNGIRLKDAGGLSLLAGEHKDREDLAIDLTGVDVLIANERCGAANPGSRIDRHSLDTGRMVARLGSDTEGQLGIFEHAAPNRGFEAIASRPNGRGFWVAPETALAVDGDASHQGSGSPVRLQLLDDELRGVAQYVYWTDPISRPISSPSDLARFSASRVVGLLVLPDDSLIVLENVFQGNIDGLPEARIRIYLIDHAQAADLSTAEFAAGIRAKKAAPVEKRRLVELAFDGADSNYEGMTLGPQLENGERSLLLIRDNGKGEDQTVYALRIRLD